MIPKYKEVHKNFKLNNRYYNFSDLRVAANDLTEKGQDYEKAIGDFLREWTNDKDFIEVQTSGSTGAPKLLQLKKVSMVQSALITGSFFGLKPSNKALHCLPTQFIAGKMMLVRALVLGLEIDIIEPKLIPIFNNNISYDLCAMIPVQLENCYRNCQNIRNIIVGGAAVSNQLQSDIQKCSTNIYESYGMTETITHIALRKLNGTNKSRFFNVLPNIQIEQDDRKCLVIIAEHFSERKVVTNDLVKIHSSTQFEWLGRYDNVINSGGIKLIPEQIEKKLAKKIEQRFFISSQPNSSFGESIILILEGQSKSIDPIIFEDLDKYEIPKNIYFIPEFVETKSNKINRSETLKLVK
jgi:O-succinylbenzoic acid--CoA ligase